MTFNVPVSVSILRIILFRASNFNLLETPLREIDIVRFEITAKRSMTKSEGGQERSDPIAVFREEIFNDFNGPMILFISNCQISVARDFEFALCDGCGDLM